MERRQDFSKLFEKLDSMDKRADQRHEATIQRLTKIETYRKADRDDLDDIQRQCGEHEKVIQGGKGIFALFGVLASWGIWDFFSRVKK